MKSIIIYCSKTGNTEKVADAILKGLNGNADIVKLELTSGGLMRSFNPAFTFDFTGYDRVFLGSWVMMMQVHPFMAAYINSCASLEGINIAGFLTGAAIFSKRHAETDLRTLIEAKGGKLTHFLYTTTLLGPALTRKKLKLAEKFASSVLKEKD
ncbi:flavodoxin [Candidatus Magnetoovum chiemensis]|nr:flavodoxin [Candidatus Magnetoovum chiemensis]